MINQKSSIGINRRVELTDEITLYKGEFYEKISLFNFFII